MRLQHPDDELGGMLLLALPQLVVHRIDPWSPLYPTAYSRHSHMMGTATPANSFRYPEILQRAADGENGNRDPHFAQQISEPRLAQHHTSGYLNVETLADHLGSRQLEFACVVEGIDPSTSSTLQSRHSYTCDDIVFNAFFQKCVYRGKDGACEVNFNAFHELMEVSDSSEIFIQSMP